MRYAPAVLLGTALFSLAVPARADQIPWYYSWSRSPALIFADGSTTSYIALSSEKLTKTLGTTTIEATNVFTYGGGPDGPPAQFSTKDFTLTLNVWDANNQHSGSVSFDGELFGYLTPTVSHIQSYYAGVTTKSLTLGKDIYNVHLSTYAPSGPDCTTPEITAMATVTVQTLPEPPAAILGALAFPAAGLFWLRRRLSLPRPG